MRDVIYARPLTVSFIGVDANMGDGVCCRMLLKKSFLSTKGFDLPIGSRSINASIGLLSLAGKDFCKKKIRVIIWLNLINQFAKCKFDLFADQFFCTQRPNSGIFCLFVQCGLLEHILKHKNVFQFLSL